MVLYLIREKILNYPVLFLSNYLNKNKPKYYKNLLRVSSDNDWENFIFFMLQGIAKEAKETKESIIGIQNAYNVLKKDMKSNLPKIYSIELLQQLFAYPVVTPVRLAKELGVHYITASSYLKALKGKGYLKDMKLGKYHMYINHELISLLHNRFN